MTHAPWKRPPDIIISKCVYIWQFVYFSRVTSISLDNICIRVFSRLSERRNLDSITKIIESNTDGDVYISTH